ncbi:MAG TPA: P1 family peptidase [Bryobacteraceae bacterium]|nr:P1 family peptidase [Bryobacteraceae bacterium]HZW91917.1 P1 family peptidase [Candidatus Eremiobacteraceae bacterium]
MEKITMTVGAVAIGGLAMLASLRAQSTPANSTITAVPGIKVGHFTLTERPTGCTVVLTEAGATAGVDVRGGAPGTRETDLLNPINSVQQVHAIVLAGGSAFGLDAASGVVRYLDEKNAGFKVESHGQLVNVPIVPAAILIDLGVGGSPKIRPNADCGYRAASAATTGPVIEGNVGAGAGATVGKIAGFKRAMKGGLGSAAIRMPDGLIVGAIVAVNALGDVIDPATGRVVAGVRTEDGRHLADARLLLRSDRIERPQIGANSTIGVIATNAPLTKTQATKIAQMAQDGYARAISPIHTPADGDTVFALATATSRVEIDITRIGALAADVMAEAILRAVQQATSIPGYPAARDLKN